MTAPVNRSVWIDNLRLMATIAVIVVHVATPLVFVKTSADMHNWQWWTGNVYDSLCRFCVPVFIMLTGALLFPQEIELTDFFKKRFNRILLPFLFWTIIYIAFNWALKIRDEGTQQAFAQAGPWLFGQLTNGAAFHLWYIYMLIGLYLFIPILQPWITSASNKFILYFLGIWFLTLVFHQQNFLTVNTYFDLSYFSGYAGYLVLGYFIAHRITFSKNLMYFASVLFITGFTVTLAGTYMASLKQGSFSHVFYEYLTFNVLFAATGIFIIIKNIANAGAHNALPSKARLLISRYGYGIYLSHLLIVSILSHFNIDYSLLTPLIGIPLVSVACLAISMALVYSINKLPYGKYISG